MEGGGVWGINEVLGGEEERKGEKDEKKSSDGSHQLNFIEVRWVQTIAEQTLLRGVKTHTHTHTRTQTNIYSRISTNNSLTHTHTHTHTHTLRYSHTTIYTQIKPNTDILTHSYELQWRVRKAFLWRS